MPKSIEMQRSAAYAAQHKQNWLQRFFPENHFTLRDWGFLSLLTSGLFFFFSLFFTPCLIIAFALVAFTVFTRVFNPVAHAPKDEFALTMPDESLTSACLPTNFKPAVQPQNPQALYTGDIAPRRYHAFEAADHPARLYGDLLKATILNRFATELDKCNDLASLRATVKAQVNSEAYVKLATGQGFLTRCFDLKTTSQEKYEEMCRQRASGFYVSMMK